MAFKSDLLEQWVDTEMSGDRLVSFVVTSTFTPTTPSITTAGGGLMHGRTLDLGDSVRRLTRERLGLEPDGSLGGHQSTFLVMTNDRLALGTRSSVRNRPRDLVHAAPLADARVYWFDHDAGSGNRFRHFVTDFGDGRWRADRTGLTALGRDVAKTSNGLEFVKALGDHAVEVTVL